MQSCDNKLSSTIEMYTKQLIEGTSTYKGVMRKRNKTSNTLNIPFKHQKKCVRNWIERKNQMRHFMLLDHDMGTGKSATLMQIYAALVRDEGKKIKMIISVPSVTLTQWRQTIEGWLCIKKDRLLITSNQKDITNESIENKSIVLVSHNVIVTKFKQCYKYYPKHHKPENKTYFVGAWDLMDNGFPDFIENEIVAPFNMQWDLLGIDEAHKCANVKSVLCNAHAKLSETCKQRVLMTGTVCLNRPSDVAGMAKAGNAVSWKKEFDYQVVKSWSEPLCQADTVNKFTVNNFRREFVDSHRMQMNSMQLPELEQIAVNFNVNFNQEEYEEYQEILEEARILKRRVNTNRDIKDMLVLMQSVVRLSQFLVSPLLAQLGAKKFSTSNYNLQESTENPSCSVKALCKQIQNLRELGHDNVIVASASVGSMLIAAHEMKKNKNYEYGEIFMFTGNETKQARESNKMNFLSSNKAVMFLSISAGSTGLHLVPGCECMVLWGMSSYTPAIIEQCIGRIYRYGQKTPKTGKITIIHLLAYGSAEFAIGSLHKDKKKLMRLIQEGCEDGFGNNNDAKWKKTIRVVNNCLDLTKLRAHGQHHHTFVYLTKDLILAIAMGLHKRLGCDSDFSNIDEEIMIEIIRLCFGYGYYSFPEKSNEIRLVHNIEA